MALRPPGGARTVIIDFPWMYENWSEKGQWKSATNHYECVPTGELCEFPLDLILADDAVVLMWVTWPLMLAWPRVIGALGLTYAGLAWEWRKFNPKTGKYAFGGGYGTRKNIEPCLLCTYGDPQLKVPFSGMIEMDGMMPFETAYWEAVKVGARSVRDFIDFYPTDEIRAPRRQHSRKPDEQYERAELLFDGPYIELFATQERPGWKAWGNQLGKFDGVNSGATLEFSTKSSGRANR